MTKVCMDGNTAAAHIAYALSDVASIYPITPSSTMAELVDEWATNDKKNLFGESVNVMTMQSEAGAAGTVHGSLVAGALTTTFTASQGLLLMIPNMYKIAGELLPAVFHVTARALSTHALSIFGDQSDVMSTRSTGFSMICSANVQETMDLALVSHIAAINSSLPFMHFFDGFRTSHEVQKIQEISYDDIKKILPFKKIEDFRERALNPQNPHQQGTAQNPDIYFQNREASNLYYDKVYDNVVNAMKDVEKITKRKYAPFDYFGAPDANKVVIVMGSASETIEETLTHLNLKGQKLGLIKVRLYRPFNSKAFLEKLPKSVKKIAVLDRTKECGSNGEPLYQDVITAIMENNRKFDIVVGGRYGIGGKEFTPACAKAVFDNLDESIPKNHFTVGIEDDITNTSLKLDNHFFIKNENCYEMKFYGLGSDGTISANKNSIKIIGKETNKYIQGYFEYDSKKSGSLTISHLRVCDTPIKSTYTILNADLIAIHNFSYLTKYDMLNNLKIGGTVLLNTIFTKDELKDQLPSNFVAALKDKKANLYIINATKLAMQSGLGNKINSVMQTAFFKVSNIIDFEIAVKLMKEAIIKTYGKKGEQVIKANINAIENARNSVKKITLESLGSGKTYNMLNKNTEPYFENFIKPIEMQEGNKLPVSSFSPDGYVPTATSQYEKRGIAEILPKWIRENCIQCGRCVMACPHAALRAVLTEEKNLDDKPEDFLTSKAFGVPGKEYKIQLSPLDCTGCTLCSRVCPVKNKALEMVDATLILDKEKINYEYTQKLEKSQSPFNKNTVKGIQFYDPYFEFSGACAGCGETPYIKLVTQLFGKNMIIANATGCSSIYGGSAPTCPYSKDKDGCGPAWASSLFEDNAEFGLGIRLGISVIKNKLKALIQQLLKQNIKPETKTVLKHWIENSGSTSYEEAKQLIKILIKEKPNILIDEILKYKDYLSKKSVWIIGGDGWAYDIGYGGIDHILNSHENVNILVLDTELYSNTGGQSSKSSPAASVIKFAASGKNTKKKDLGLLAICSNNAYVAQISLGADMQQAIKAMTEAEKFDGPSIIIAYSPCINQGINLANSQEEMKKAVDSGYFTLYRYNPKNENALEIDSEEPTLDYMEFLEGENRYRALKKANPEHAKMLYEKSKSDASERLKNLKRFLK